MDSPDTVRTLMLSAALTATVTGRTVNVFRGFDGELDASEFVPLGKQRREWLRVLPGGRIENGLTGELVCTAKDLLIQSH